MIDKDYFKNVGFEVEEESFTFGEYNSMDNRMFMANREAPTPSEREIVESVPYMQGVYDFSQLNGGERYFDNREITYQVMLFEQDYPTRKYAEKEIKRQLMPLGIQPLYDSHDNGCHWLGKCKSVTVDDDAEKGTLACTVVFDCYPFAISNDDAGADIWDNVYFPQWFFQTTEYRVDDKTEINLYNWGSRAVHCSIDVSGNVTITGDFGEIALSQGHYQDTQMVLAVGNNKMSMDGRAVVKFGFYVEVMY
ncbi:hypothetical protein FC65_GL001619 [Ligilactobacillus acidipiscis DSM 15836]|uniref:Prophage protein n=1 Tax=Ligilactobacillus acidipiscis DSM 15836 TaxID=1423716 RepID=A0ABR5PKA1_9LACO|nr:hypothetical protein [Ligilactobacillus acidipiscis]KRM28717.1 hypothetical protein FC65_GL001619 [Ligilactobacillus acidipiscis DSM 15836]GAW63381.1 prophage protein [Ligilactobacillus acidipiscis]GEN19590.1 hypothetical protein LAC02_28710 [Ligilactobacillus acidipiscis]